MSDFTPKVLSYLLMGIYLFTLYFQAKFKSFIGFSLICILSAILLLLNPVSLGMQFLIITILALVMLVFSLKEISKFKQQGISIVQPTYLNVAFGLILFGIYVLVKILYFDELTK